jgi:hypothetical protein
MRYSELLEYKRDITATNLGKQLIDRLSKEPTIRGDVGSIVGDLLNPRFPDSTYNYTLETGVVAILKLFEDVDPTPNKQYTEWLVRRYIDGSIVRFEDVLSTWADLLHEYHRLKTRRLLPPELMDINKFKTEQDLKQLHKSVLDIFNSTDEKVEVQKGESTEILNNSEVRIIIPEDQKAACYYGQGTRWCTAAKNNNMYDNYDWPLFILVPKNPTHEGEKYQVQVSGGDWMDETDSPVSVIDIVNRFPTVNLKEVFGKYDRDAWYLTDYIPWYDTVEIFDAMIKQIITNEQYIIENYVDTSRDESAVADFKQLIKDMKGWDAESLAESVTEMMDYQRDMPIDNGGFRMMAYEYPDALGVWIRETTGAGYGYDLFDYIIDTMTVELNDVNAPHLLNTKMTNN